MTETGRYIMKKIWILLLVVVMVGGLLAVPGTALAKPGGGNGKPPGPPEGQLYSVTMQLVPDMSGLGTMPGLATMCNETYAVLDEPTPIVMRGTLKGTTLELLADGNKDGDGTSYPILYLKTRMVGYRYFPDDDRNPETTSEVSFTGCHGGSPWYSIEDPFYEDGALINHPGVLMVAIDGDTITFGVWHFDYWWEETSATHGKKTVSDIDVVEHFSMHADPITMTGWNGTTGTVTGEFGIDHWVTDTHTDLYIPNDTVDSQELIFTITVTPQES
jgi:hypothetical protein